MEVEETQQDSGEDSQDSMPVIDYEELRDEHAKAYVERSVKRAAQRFARREGISDSEAIRFLILRGLEHPSVFGGYRLKSKIASEQAEQIERDKDIGDSRHHNHRSAHALRNT